MIDVLSGIGAFKAMYDAAKALKDINDATVRGAAVIELTEKILTAQAAQTALLEEVRELKEKIARFETWEAQKRRYELKRLGFGATAYMLKKEERGTETPHWACAHCYQNGKIFILQFTTYGATRQNARRGWFCPACHNEIETSDFGIEPTWLD